MAGDLRLFPDFLKSYVTNLRPKDARVRLSQQQRQHALRSIEFITKSQHKGNGAYLSIRGHRSRSPLCRNTTRSLLETHVQIINLKNSQTIAAAKLR